MPMEFLKSELVRLGIYGTKLSNFSQADIDKLYNKEYVEIYYTQDRPKLVEDAKGDSVIKLRDYKIIMENLDLLSIRIKYSIFKEHLAQYKFKEEYPYKAIDYFLNAEDWVTTAELKEKVGIDPKKVFYITKRLRENDLLDFYRQNGFWYYKIKKDLIFENGNIDLVYEAPVIPQNLSMEIPIIDQIKDLINNSMVGITTEDIQKQLGLSVRQGLHYLNRITDLERSKFKCKEIFIGKIRRLLFYKVIENEEITPQIPEESNFVTVEDRTRVLDEMLTEKKGFVISDETIKQFQIKLNSNFLPCKKTIMSTALKSGHKIFTLKDKCESKTLVVHKDVSIASYLNETEDKSNIEFKNPFEKTFYNKFVLNVGFIRKDNLFISNEMPRNEFFCDYLLSRSTNGYLILDKEFISKMSLKDLFKFIPIDIPNVIPEILQQKTSLNDHDAEKPDIEKLEVLTHEDLYKRKLTPKHTKKLKISLSYRRVTKKILDLESVGLIQKFIKDEGEPTPEDLENFDTSKFTVNTVTKIFGDNEKKDLAILLLNNPFVIKIAPDYKDIIKNTYHIVRKPVYIDYTDRIKCFTTLRNNNKPVAYKLIKKFIKQKYITIYKELMRTIDEIFGTPEEDTHEILLDNPNVQEFLYTKIKYDLVKSDYLDPSKFVEYSSVDSVLEKLKQDDIIYPEQRKMAIDNVRMRAKHRSKLVKNLEMFNDPKFKGFTERDTIYRMYFPPFYDLLVKTGSMELNELLDKIKVCMDFEFINFVKAYNDVFEISEIDNLKIISIKIDIDPFDFI